MKKLTKIQMAATKGGFLFEIFAIIVCVACLVAGIYVGMEIAS